MKEKIIEKRVIKMKKVFVTLLMLMMVVGLFAAPTETVIGMDDTLKITANVENDNAVGFTVSEYKIEDTLSPIADGAPETKLAGEDYSTSFWASVRTNHASPITVKVYATGLAKPYDTTTVGLKINNITFDAMPSESYATSGVGENIAGEGKVISFPEDGTKTGLRAFSNNLSISAEDLKSAEAGDYSAYITMIVEEGSTT